MADASTSALSSRADPVSSQEMHDALQTILSDEETFQKVVDTVFQNMDVNGNGQLEPQELAAFMANVCVDMGVQDPPNAMQVHHVFKHLDLNGDNGIEKDELEVFLRHLFSEQLRQAKEAQEKAKTQAQVQAQAQAQAASPLGKAAEPGKKASLWKKHTGK